jgi:hypothetical protein
MGIRLTPVRHGAALGALLVSSSLAAQSACDSVQIHLLQYAPFTDTALIVVAQNNGTEFLSYPQFSLIATGGDTLARENINFFGLGPSAQTHLVPLIPGEDLPSTPFTGTLELRYITVNGDASCAFPFSGGLCPTTFCTPLNVYLYNFGTFEVFTADFPWNVTNSEGLVVGSGTLSIDADDQQQDFGELCLAPGHYELHVSQDGDVGEHYMFGVTQGEAMFNVSGPSAELQAGSQATLPFSYYPACISGTNAIDEVRTTAPRILADGRQVMIIRDGLPLGQLAVFDSTGRRVQRTSTSASSIAIDLSGAAPGAYVVRSVTGTWPAQRFILP